MGELAGRGAAGHTGFTGTSLVLDRATDTFLVLLANTVHPRRRTSGSAPRAAAATRLARCGVPRHLTRQGTPRAPRRISVMHEELRAALAGLLDGLPPKQAAQAVERLIANYRGRTPTDAPVLRDRADVAAYAAYRMPATFEAVRAALARVRRPGPGLGARPRHVDIGGGTGAATWAAAATWDRRSAPAPCWTGPSPPSPSAGNWPPPTRPLTREWRRQHASASGADVLASTDLVTVSYVLGELPPRTARAVVAAAARRGQAVVVDRTRHPRRLPRIIEARDPADRRRAAHRRALPAQRRLPDRPGRGLVPLLRPGQPLLPAPPGQGRLTAVRGREVQLRRRHPLRRRTPPPARIVRKPQIRKGQVLLDLCTTTGRPRSAPR